MQPIQLFDPVSSTYSYILFDELGREALIIDPVDVQIERDLATLRQFGLRLLWTVETHAHADHITSAGQLAELAGANGEAAGPHHPHETFHGPEAVQTAFLLLCNLHQ